MVNEFEPFKLEKMKKIIIPFAIILLNFSCKKESSAPINSTNQTNNVVHLYSVPFNGQTLFVSPFENDTVPEWGGYGVNVSTDSNNGDSNTVSIVATLGTNNGNIYAAKVCDTLTLNGYTDWYLPSMNELNALYLNRDSLNMSSWYWTSSAVGALKAHIQNFFYSSYGGDASRLQAGGKVRCIRK